MVVDGATERPSEPKSPESDLDDATDMAHRPPSRRPVDGSKRQTPAATRRLRRLLISAVIAAVAVGGFFVATRSSGPKYTTFHDQAGGFSVTYPAGWIAHAKIDANLRLFLQVNANSVDSVTIRVDPTQAVVNTTDLVDMKAFTDAVISGSHPNVSLQAPLTLNGVHGYYYEYTLQDPSSGETLTHFHYFLFQNHTMLGIVLQATKSDLEANGGRLAAQFDLLRASIHGSA
jgi:hypothetical protein